MSEDSARRTWPATSRLILRRLAELAAATTLADLRNAPGRCHPLRGQRRGQYALHTSGRERLVFEPLHNPLPILADGGLDLERVTVVRVIEIVDYHGD